MVDFKWIFLSFFNRLPWQPEFFMDFNSFSYFEKGPPKDHSCEVWWILAKWFKRRCYLSKKLTTHDTRRTTDDWRRTTDDGQRAITIAHLELCSGELKRAILPHKILFQTCVTLRILLVMQAGHEWSVFRWFYLKDHIMQFKENEKFLLVVFFEKKSLIFMGWAGP